MTFDFLGGERGPLSVALEMKCAAEYVVAYGEMWFILGEAALPTHPAHHSKG